MSRRCKKAKLSPSEVKLLMEKASHSDCTYRVSAIAFDSKGDILGHATNRHSEWNVLDKDGTGRAGTARHAERILLRRYRDLVKSIVICRIGRSGELRPIDPCPICSKVAGKYGATIRTIS